MEMESAERFSVLENDDKYDKRCGEVFLTVKGNIIFHCTLCDTFDKFEGFPSYADHVQQKHYQETSMIEENPLDCDDFEENEFKPASHNEEFIDIEVIINRDVSVGEEKIDLQRKEVNEQEIQDQMNILVSHSEGPVASSAERKHICKICGFAFKQYFNLRAHVRRHLTTKRFTCTHCSKAFHTRTEMETHERRHKGERPFICEQCGQGFISSGVLTMHAKRHKNLRQHCCTICDKKFFDSYALRLHTIGHTNERPFDCDVCHSSFARKKSLAVHKKIHENKREYKCQYCDSSFNQKPGLYSHIKIKHSRNGDENTVGNGFLTEKLR